MYLDTDLAHHALCGLQARLIEVEKQAAMTQAEKDSIAATSARELDAIRAELSAAQFDAVRASNELQKEREARQQAEISASQIK